MELIIKAKFLYQDFVFCKAIKESHSCAMWLFCQQRRRQKDGVKIALVIDFALLIKFKKDSSKPISRVLYFIEMKPLSFIWECSCLQTQSTYPPNMLPMETRRRATSNLAVWSFNPPGLPRNFVTKATNSPKNKFLKAAFSHYNSLRHCLVFHC